MVAGVQPVQSHVEGHPCNYTGTRNQEPVAAA